MKNYLLYLLIVIIILGGGFYAVELQQEREIIEKKTEEDVGAVKATKKIKEEKIIELQTELKDLEKERDVLQKEKIELKTKIKGLETETTELKAKIKDIENLDVRIKRLQQDKSSLETIIKQHPERLEQKLRDPTWAELKNFLKIDKTNELVFDPERFDCSGFAITLFRNARAAGIRTAYVEVVFGTTGHALNKFRTTDRGYVFVDVTGDKKGTGRDTVAYIKKGELFATIHIDNVTETKIDCRRIGLCRDFINPLPIIKHTELFTYPFFQEKVACRDLYIRCLPELNTEISRFNHRASDLNREQLTTWINNNTKLLNQLITGQHWVYTETNDRVTNVEIYW